MTKIIIVEDEQGLQTILKYNLEKEGYNVVVETNGAKVTSVDAWGQKTLAYEIKVGRNTYKSGYYFVVTIEAGDDKAVKEFDRLALISQDVIRHLIINKED